MGTNGTDIAAEPRLEEEKFSIQKMDHSLPPGPLDKTPARKRALDNRLPEAVARSAAFGRFLGADRRARLAHRFQRNVSGFGSNVSLGFFLGMTPAVASFFGLPLEVRHVTLSSGALALAAVTLPLDAFLGSPFLWAIAGLAVIAFLNFTVSFALAFTVAARACGLTGRDLRRLVLVVWKALKETPSRFFLPPAEGPAAPLAPPEASS